MPEPNDANKETVRIAPPTRKPAAAENARINLPARPPVTPAAPPAGAPQEERRLPSPPPDSQIEGPKKETANVVEAARRTAVEMKKTQPLITMPEPESTPAVPLTFTSEPQLPSQEIPLGLCWAVLIVSAVILILQIWNYFA